jgi:hypothetical protein
MRHMLHISKYCAILEPFGETEKSLIRRGVTKLKTKTKLRGF